MKPTAWKYVNKYTEEISFHTDKHPRCPTSFIETPLYVIPEGMVLVPREPTDEMFNNARWSGNRDCDIRESWVLAEIYKRMIAAWEKENGN